MSNTNLNDVSVDDDKGGHFYPADGQQPQPEEGQQNDQPGSGTTLFEDVSGMQMRTLGMIAIGVSWGFHLSIAHLRFASLQFRFFATYQVGVGVVLLLACVGVCCYLRRGTRALPGSPPTFRAPGNEEVRAPYTAAIRNRDFMVREEMRENIVLDLSTLL